MSYVQERVLNIERSQSKPLTMSELKSQVSKLREQYLPTQSLSHGRASLFLSPKEAASVDVDTIHESAVNGLKAIIQYDSRFSVYLTTIFHQSTISLQRELKTKAENIELDKQLHDLLYLLAPYVLEPSCHTVLEYLIRRYRINDLNIDSLMAVVLPRHDNKVRLFTCITVSAVSYLSFIINRFL